MKTVWVTRDKGSDLYKMWIREPVYENRNNDGVWFWFSKDPDIYRWYVNAFCAKWFESITGYKMRGGKTSIFELEFS